ncbi:hypothetical protein BUALT_Bualt14G0071100 [Buddleja alternifolia]|uniref:Disease resistance protein RGA3 n=1 Tax=Buddleja alternifolia TaxID=168488 RepID=A0AAV6WSN9_9LAMI|nr:hypothetical protein BUALT_Bualt14G0071100 [Buddleja alternifolia]
MADASVSMVLTRLAPLIEKRVRDEVSLLLDANNEVKSLSEKLKKIQEVLVDAERKGVTDPNDKSWLDKLQEIAYEIDDTVDEWEVENIRQQLQEYEDSSGSSSEDPWQKVSFFLESVCLCFKQTAHRRSIALDVKHIHQKLDSIAQQNENEFNFIHNIGGVSRAYKRDESTSFFEVSEVHGRVLDKEKLMSKLLLASGSSSQGEDDIQVISIVGTGGMEKTTLAQLVFNEFKNQTEFKPIWICFFDPFDEIKIAQTILNALKTTYPTNSQFETLLNCIEESIERKKLFLVLDDVWTENDTMWKPLKKSLKSGAPGSIVLVTTRKEKVAEVMGSTHDYPLDRISDLDCWLVLSQIAFKGRRESECEMLKKTGEEIAKKCKGMPLAAKTIGGLLHSKTTLQQWKNVLNSAVLELEEVKNDLFPLLTLSYNELEPTKKRCFSYCAIFPKDSIIVVNDLIRMWMAQEDFKYPQGFEKLTNLLTLEEYSSNKLGYLKDLNQLQGFLHIKLMDGMDEVEVMIADLKNKIFLQWLELDVEREEFLEIMEDIHPPPNLEGLTFKGPMSPKWWEEWEDISEENNMISIMPCLQELKIDNCLLLKALPHRLLRKASSLQVLVIEYCPYLTNHYNRETGEDWDKVSHISKVDIDRISQ